MNSRPSKSKSPISRKTRKMLQSKTRKLLSSSLKLSGKFRKLKLSLIQMIVTWRKRGKSYEMWSKMSKSSRVVDKLRIKG